MTAAVDTQPVTGRAFRNALGQFPTGVCVVTCAPRGQPLGMTISSFNSLSLQPPLVLFSIDKRALSLEDWLSARHCAIHVLSENQADLSARFATAKGRKWAGLEYREGRGGVPLLRGVAARFECTRWAQHDGGDHILFIVEVQTIEVHPDRRPIVYCNGRYASLERGRSPVTALGPELY